MSPDVVIVGGGIIGCALARELARAGGRVTLLERGQPGGEASSAAAGMLGPHAECDAPGPLLELGLASLRRYPSAIDALRGETGIDPEYDTDGIIYVALDADDEAILMRRAAWQHAAGFAVRHLTARDVRRLEPCITAEVRSALLFPDDHRVDNVRLARAYAVAAARAGVHLRPGVAVRAIRRSGDRVTGVESATGERIPAARVVNAAGAWTSALASGVPVKPVRGQMVSLVGARPILRHAVYSRAVYLVPRRDGRLLAGSTYEDAGFDKRVTGEAVGGILTRGVRLVRDLADATFAEAWAGLRPGTPDQLPILGHDPAVVGLYHATGHYRHGILLAPITAEVLTELIVAGRPSMDLAPFAAGRFVPPRARDR